MPDSSARTRKKPKLLAFYFALCRDGWREILKSARTSASVGFAALAVFYFLFVQDYLIDGRAKDAAKAADSARPIIIGGGPVIDSASVSAATDIPWYLELSKWWLAVPVAIAVVSVLLRRAMERCIDAEASLAAIRAVPPDVAEAITRLSRHAIVMPHCGKRDGRWLLNVVAERGGKGIYVADIGRRLWAEDLEAAQAAGIKTSQPTMESLEVLVHELWGAMRGHDGGPNLAEIEPDESNKAGLGLARTWKFGAEVWFWSRARTMTDPPRPAP